MATDWDVEGALDELADAVAGGAMLLELDKLTREMVKSLYRRSFEKRSEAEWRLARPTILDLAATAGRNAENATIAQWARNVGTVGEFLDYETVCLVCVLVSRLDCPLTEGGFCPDAACTSAAGERLNEILEQLRPSA